jgi:hypothetical protein
MLARLRAVAEQEQRFDVDLAGMRSAHLGVGIAPELDAVTLRLDLPEVEGELCLSTNSALDVAMRLLGACMRLHKLGKGQTDA